MGYDDEMASFSDAMFSDEAFGELVIIRPRGSIEDQFEIAVVVDQSNQEGSNQMRGEGRGSLNSEHGRSVVSELLIEIPRTRTLDDGSVVEVVISESGKDRVVIHPGQSSERVLPIRRIVASDRISMTVLASQTDQFAPQVKRPSRF